MSAPTKKPWAVRAPRVRRRLLFAGEVLIVLAAVTALLAVVRPGPLTLMLFLVVGQPAIILGVLLYVAVAIAEFRASHGVSRMTFGPGEIVFREGDPGDFMYAVIEGEVEILREQEGRDATVMARLGPGQYFGEIALLSAGPRVATVRTVTAVEVALMGRGDFAALYAYLPDFHSSIERLVRRRAVEWGKRRSP